MDDPLQLRPATRADVPAMMTLFHASVHLVAAADYDAQQREAWAPAVMDRARWERRLDEQQVRVAEHRDALAGFCTWNAEGCLDLLYVHPDHLRRGVASALCAAAEADLRLRGVTRLHTQASLTAQPFFQRQGFRLVQRQTVEIRGVVLPNAVMEKILA
jgi:putative acetyltransferase